MCTYSTFNHRCSYVVAVVVCFFLGSNADMFDTFAKFLHNRTRRSYLIEIYLSTILFTICTCLYMYVCLTIFKNKSRYFVFVSLPMYDIIQHDNPMHEAGAAIPRFHMRVVKL